MLHYLYLDILVLLEKAIQAATSRQYEVLAEVANSLEQLLITIITDDVEFDFPIFTWEEEEKSKLQALHGATIRIPIVRTKIHHTTAVLFGGTDSSMSSTNGKNNLQDLL
jgi:hypothetical protein